MASQGNNYSEKGAYRYNESSSSGATFAHPVKTNSESSNTRHESVVMVESAPATQRTVVSQGYGIQEHLATVGSPYDHQAPPPNQRRRHYKKRSYVWTAGVILVCSIVFVVEMFVNNCPKHERDNAGNQASQRCIVRFLGRLSFQPLKENPLFGPSTSAYCFLEFSILLNNLPLSKPFLFSVLSKYWNTQAKGYGSTFRKSDKKKWGILAPSYLYVAACRRYPFDLQYVRNMVHRITLRT